MSNAPDLPAIRAEIDRVDGQIQELVTARARLAEQVAAAKQGSGEDSNFYRPEREAQVLRTVAQRNQGPLSDQQMVAVFQEIMSACLALQKPLNVAFLGPEGTFTQAATYRHFGHSVSTVALDSIDSVFREVESGRAHYGLVPVENSTEGVVNHTLDMFMRSTLRICGEVSMRINHCLLGNTTDLDAIERVYSHPQSLAQCRRWLDSNLPGAVCIGVNSNAEGARLAAETEKTAAVAGVVAAESYDLSVIAENIEDEPDNTTRFLVIGDRDVGPTGEDKTTLLLSTRNQSGSLHRLLEPLATGGISMTRIESRPSRRTNWDYVFFIDILGHAEDTAVSEALEQLQRDAAMFRNLGSYPVAVS